MSTNDVLSAVGEAIAEAVGVAATTRAYRANPIGNETEIMVSVLATSPRGNNAYHDVVVLCHAPYLKSTAEELEAAETNLNNIQDAIFDALPDWRRGIDPVLYPWQAVSAYRPATRPPSPPELKQWRLGQIFLRIHL